MEVIHPLVFEIKNFIGGNIMNTMVIVAVLLCAVVFGESIWQLRDFKFTTRSMARIALVSAATISLYMVKLVPFPQGGGCSLLSILPIMILAIMYGRKEAIISAVVVAMLKIVIAPPYFLMQLPLDYFGGMIAVAYTSVFGTETKKKLLLGAVFAGLLSTIFSVLSGAIFFGQFAPAGMHPFVYSLGYNFLGYGVEVAMSIAVLSVVGMRFRTKLMPEAE